MPYQPGVQFTGAQQTAQANAMWQQIAAALVQSMLKSNAPTTGTGPSQPAGTGVPQPVGTWYAPWDDTSRAPGGGDMKWGYTAGTGAAPQSSSY
jgi:hypothetical protein